MGADQNFDWRAAAGSALEWWRDAGVDILVDEAPRDWLALPSQPIARVALAEPVPTTSLPQTLKAFAAWRLGPDAPEAAWPGRRMGAQGNPAAPLWVFTDLPERDDLAEGRLLAGAQGRLFDNMLAAIGQTREAVHLVPICTARPPGRITAEMEARFAEIARHYLMAGTPRRVLLLGETASRCVLGVSCRDARGSLHSVNHPGQEVAQTSGTIVVASFHPRLLIERPTAKADAWRDLRLVRDVL